MVSVLGVEFYPITRTGAHKALDWMLSLRDGKTRLVVTGNPLMVMAARKDEGFRQILERADLLVPDGVGVIWAARKAGPEAARMLPERITGVDLTNYLLRMKPSPGIFLCGGKPGVAERAADQIKTTMPWVSLRGCHHGYFDVKDEPKVVEQVKASGAGVVLVGMGSPRQEKFLWRNKQSLGARLGMGVGGVLDILAGEKAVAPRAVQKMGMEWLYRLIREPSRLGADFALLEFAVRVQLEALSRRTKQPEGAEDDDFS